MARSLCRAPRAECPRRRILDADTRKLQPRLLNPELLHAGRESTALSGRVEVQRFRCLSRRVLGGLIGWKAAGFLRPGLFARLAGESDLQFSAVTLARNWFPA